MKHDYTMDDFRAEMRRRGVYGRAVMQAKEHCTTCDGTTFIDATDSHGQSYRGCKRCRITPETGSRDQGEPA